MPTKDARFLWTLTLRGGTPFVLRVPGNPTLEHDGGTTVQHLYVSRQEAGLISETCQQNGAVAEFSPMSSASLSQKEERKRVFQRPNEISVPCTECLTCPWYDPITLGEGKTCFLREAPRESSRTLMENSNDHYQAAINCPLNKE